MPKITNRIITLRNKNEMALMTLRNVGARLGTADEMYFCGFYIMDVTGAYNAVMLYSPNREKQKIIDYNELKNNPSCILYPDFVGVRYSGNRWDFRAIWERVSV